MITSGDFLALAFSYLYTFRSDICIWFWQSRIVSLNFCWQRIRPRVVARDRSDLFLFVQSPNRRHLLGSHWSTHHRQRQIPKRHYRRKKSIFFPPQINIWSRNRYGVPLAENTFITFNKWCHWLSSISVRKAVCVYLSKSCILHLLSKIYLSCLLSLYLWQMHLWG